MGKEELYKDFCWFPENMAIVPKLAAVEQKKKKKNTKILATVEVVWTGVFDDDSGGTGVGGLGSTGCDEDEDAKNLGMEPAILSHKASGVFNMILVNN